MSQHTDPEEMELLQEAFIDCAKAEFQDMTQVVLEPKENNDDIFVAGKLFIVGIIQGSVAMAMQSLDGSPNVETKAELWRATTLLPDSRGEVEVSDILALVAEKVNTITVLAVGLDGQHQEKAVLFHHPLIDANKASTFLRTAMAATQAMRGGNA